MTAYLTIEQAAERAQVSRSTIKKWIKEGLPILVFGPKLKRIRIDSFDDWLERHTSRKIAGTPSSLVQFDMGKSKS
jgi:excisionase family DNA binding protein